MIHLRGRGTNCAGRLWKLTLLVAAGTIAALTRAEATLHYWSDSEIGYSRAKPIQPQLKPRRLHAKKVITPQQESRPPQGPLIISISIEKQSMRVFDGKGLFAETPISTGMKGHPTPMGVFSVIQKHRLHHSNIYSGAPMPYMQRITWSGVALHAGVLPGYPASHGCIRMPMAFALKMWKWTKMGARVVVTPGELTPASFSHPLLAAQLSKPRPDAPPKTYSKKPPDTVIMAAVPEVRIELAEANSDSSGNPVTASDAGPSGRNWHQDSEIRNNPIDSPASPPSVVAEPAADTVVTEASKPHPFRSVEPPSGKPEGATKPAAEDNASGPDLKGPDPATSLPLAHLGQIAVLISGKDSKLYVRQNLAPVFEVPIVVARSERSLGTHVFTAEVDKKSANLVHWSVVSLPAPSPHWEPVAGSQVRSRPRRTVEPKRVIEAETPAEALDRITVPAEAMARITDALSTGGSFILSDQSINGGETGEGTDFIVSMR